MLELSSIRKNKVNLSDYSCTLDIQNRMLMSDFTDFDVEVLEEILYSPLKISIKKLTRNLDCEEEKLLTCLHKLASSQLLQIDQDTLLIDKEMRKYFEFEMCRFDSSSKPGMLFLQGLLKKVPIHILPVWYSIPRTSNNIFESIVEKYLITPHVYQRYLDDLNFSDPLIRQIIDDVYLSKDLKIHSTDLIQKYNLSLERFYEIVLILEFNFALCLVYEKEDDHWIEMVTPFYEYKEYLTFLKKTSPQLIDENLIEKKCDCEFGFIQSMSDSLFKLKKKEPILDLDDAGKKLLLLNFLKPSENGYEITPAGESWLDLSLEDRSLQLYRHPNNQILNKNYSDREIREAEKSVKRVIHCHWIFFDEFIKGVLVCFNDTYQVSLKKIGKSWSYILPKYTKDELELIHETIYSWLYELGMVEVGKVEGKECFRVTQFGKSFFED